MVKLSTLMRGVFFSAKDEDTIRVFMCATIAVRCHADDDDMGNDIRYLMVNESSPFLFPTMNRNNLFFLFLSSPYCVKAKLCLVLDCYACSVDIGFSAIQHQPEWIEQVQALKKSQQWNLLISAQPHFVPASSLLSCDPKYFHLNHNSLIIGVRARLWLLVNSLCEE